MRPPSRTTYGPFQSGANFTTSIDPIDLFNRPSHPKPARPAQRTIWLITCRDPFPKIAIVGNPPAKGDILEVPATKGVPSKSYTVHGLEKLSVVLAFPQGFTKLPLSNWLGDFTQLNGCMIETFSAEIRLYQEIIIQLAAEKLIDPSLAATKFDKVAKLAALALGTNVGAESKLAASRAIQIARETIHIKKETTND